MEKPTRYLTLAEILGLHLKDTAAGAACRRRLELDFVLDEAAEEELARLAPRDQVLILVGSYLDVVTGNGFDSFMRRNVGDFAMQTLDALAAIGATNAHAELKQVCDLFPGHAPSRDQATREIQINEIVGPLANPDGRYVALDHLVSPRAEPNIVELLMDYWRRHGDDQPRAARP